MSLRPWITQANLNSDGDLEVQGTYADGTTAWLTVPGELAGALDLVSLLEVSKRRPPPSLARAGSQPPGGQGAQQTGQ